MLCTSLRVVLSFSVLSLGACASTDSVEILEYKVGRLTKEVERLQEAAKLITDHQEVADDQFEKLYKESAEELSSLNERIASLQGATSGIEFFSDENGAHIRPSEVVVHPMKDARSWYSSGGTNEDDDGNMKYALDVEVGGNVRITLRGIDPIDTFLYLKRDGQPLEWNDNAGRHSSVLLTHLSPGRYFIVAATNEPRQQGRFSLEVAGDRVKGRLTRLN